MMVQARDSKGRFAGKGGGGLGGAIARGRVTRAKNAIRSEKAYVKATGDRGTAKQRARTAAKMAKAKAIIRSGGKGRGR